MSNHSSATNDPAVIQKEIDNDLHLGRLRRIEALPDKFFCSPLGLVPKSSNGTQTGWRRIFDLSSPHGASVNDGIDSSFGELRYESFDLALAEIARLGKGTVMVKRDLKSAFRHIPICIQDHQYLIFEWNGRFYVDLFLPFGLRTAPFIFNLFAEALHWILQNEFGWVVHHYLDDFIIFLTNDIHSHQVGIQFQAICSQLGFNVAEDKSIEGTQVEYLGITIDSEKMEARLPQNKKDHALAEINRLLQTTSQITKSDLQSVLGFLTFCTRVFPLGRPFLRHLFNMLNSQFSHQRLTLAARRDLQWWKTLLPLWSGIAAIALTRTKTTIATDASGRKGIGGIWFATMKMFSTRLPRRHRTKHINYKEMHAIWHAFAEWSDAWRGHAVEIKCDNIPVVAGINNRTIRGDAIDPLQSLLLLAAIHDIEVRATWIPTKENAIADALSRFDMNKLANLVGQQHTDSLQSRQPSRISHKTSLLKHNTTSTTG
jgi:Reverse transcriptase (RNA-dependent DNA polymerase)